MKYNGPTSILFFNIVYSVNISILFFNTMFHVYSGCGILGFDNVTHYRYIKVDEQHASSKSMLHTMFHILGRYHEHQRADREKYIKIIREYVIEGKNASNLTYFL